MPYIVSGVVDAVSAIRLRHYYACLTSSADAYNTVTTESHKPSLSKPSGRSKTLQFVASIQHAHNVGLIVQCKECEMCRLVYALRKLPALARHSISCLLEDYTSTCGANLQELELPASLIKCVFVTCNATIL